VRIVAVIGLTLGSVAWGNPAPPPPPPPNPPPHRPPTSQSSSPVEYRVKPGDTFTSIARERLGKESLASRIAQLNPGVDPTKLQIGQRIRLPAIPPASQPASSTTPPTRSPRSLHTSAMWDRLGGVTLGLGAAALAAAGGLYLLRRRND
jgi:hypothetical protein